MNFPTAVRTCLKKYSTFTGVASRSEYWYFWLFNFLASVILDLIGLGVLRFLWFLALAVPGLAVAVRRLHDTGRSAWWLLSAIIPPLFVVLLCLPDSVKNDRYMTGQSTTSARPSITEDSVTTSGSHCPSCNKLRLPGQTYCTGCGAKFAEN
ncbi:MAG TPA: DUF805 domain-containing protein [Acidimicrobiales bacterium]|nr:DUF805 domain-containing protein [Acidimicrobiales bacterium]